MSHYIPACIGGIVLLTLSACGPLALGQVPGIATPTAAQAPFNATSTVLVWFPPTDTPTPEVVQTPQPTPDMKPGIGTVILTDDFSSAQNWNTAVSDQASVTVTDSGLTIAAQPGIAPVATFLKGFVAGNMYAEITARPNLCRGGDDYGLLVRAPNNVAYYRFAVACNGTAGADRVSVGGPRVLQPPILSADVPVGAPGEVRLGVWAFGSEFRFFLNGRYQFSVSDKSYTTGGLGVFAHAADKSPVVVTFSALSVRSINYEPDAAPTP